MKTTTKFDALISKMNEGCTADEALAMIDVAFEKREITLAQARELEAAVTE